MQEVKDSKQATVRIGYDGRVHKTFNGPSAAARFENELKILRFLEEKECPFVPRVVDHDPARLYMVTTNCGRIVDKISPESLKAIFDELETYGVRHEDPFPRNVTYNPRLGRFCLIDFEFATNLETGEGLRLSDIESPAGRDKETKDSQRHRDT